MALMNRIYGTMLVHDITGSLRDAEQLAEGADLSAMTEQEQKTFTGLLAVLECMSREHAPYRDYVQYSIKTLYPRADFAGVYLTRAFHLEATAQQVEDAIAWFDAKKANEE